MQHTNTSSMSGGSTTSLSRSGWLCAVARAGPLSARQIFTRSRLLAYSQFRTHGDRQYGYDTFWPFCESLSFRTALSREDREITVN